MSERSNDGGNELNPAPASSPVQSGENLDGGATGSAGSTDPPARLNSDIIFALLLFVIAATNFLVSGGWGSKAWFFPNILASGMLASGVILGIQGLLQNRDRSSPTSEHAEATGEAASAEASGSSRTRIVDALWFIALFFVYVALLPFAGYIISTALFFLVAFLALGLGGSSYSRRAILSVVGALLATTAFVLVFAYGFAVPLPGG